MPTPGQRPAEGDVTEVMPVAHEDTVVSDSATLAGVASAMGVSAGGAALPGLRSPLALRPRLCSADFKLALGSRPVARSEHFTVHVARPSLQARLPGPFAKPGGQTPCPGGSAEPALGLEPGQLSTTQADGPAGPVDGVCSAHRIWRLGLVLPKRLARRSVTRSLIKHQARELWRLHAVALEQAGWLHERQPVIDWVLRLKAPWPREAFPSAASEPLRQAVRTELLALLAQCLRPGRSRGH